MSGSVEIARYRLRAGGALHRAGERREVEGVLLRVDGGFACLQPWPEFGHAPLDEQLAMLREGGSTPLIERALVMGGGERISAAQIEPWLGGVAGEGATLVAGRRLADVEREMILATLKKFDGHRTKTAEALGISRRTLTDKIKAYRKESPDGPAEIAPRRRK